jgi:hypothetical protein
MVRIQGCQFYILVTKTVLKALLVFSKSLRMKNTSKHVGNLTNYA